MKAITLRIGYQGPLVGRYNLGVGICILSLAEALLLQGEAPEELVFYIGDPTPWQRLAAPGSPVSCRFVPLPRTSRFRLLRVLWEQLVLPHRVRTDGLDLLHSPGYVMPVAARVPTVLTLFDVLALTHPELCKPATRWHYRWLLPRSAQQAEHVLVPSRVVADQVHHHLDVPWCRITVIPPGVDDVFRREPPPEELARLRRRFTLPRKFVLYAGNLEPKKNLGRLIAAFQEARRAGLEGELILVGGAGWGTPFAQPRPADGVRWLGYISRSELAGLVRLASEVAYPAVGEGFGLPVVEAMASGTVVVASAVPAVLESDPDAIVQVDPGSVSSVAASLLRARQDDGLRRQLVERGRRAAARFSWQRAAAETWRTYREVVGRRGEGR